VTPAGASEYRVDGRVVSWKAYQAALTRIGVVVKARNFLVFQNEVEALASKKPHELTELVEEISESAELRGDYEERRDEKDKAEDAAVFAFKQKKNAAAEKRMCKELRTEAARFDELTAKLAEVRQQKVLFQLFHLVKERAAVEEQREQAVKALAELEAAANPSAERLTEAKREVMKAVKEKAKTEKAMQKMRAKIEELDPKEAAMGAQLGTLEKKVASELKSLASAVEEVAQQSKDVDELEEALRKVSAEVQEAEKQTKQAESSNVSPEVIEEYRKLQAQSASRTSVLTQKLNMAERYRNLAEQEKSVLQSKIESRDGLLQATEKELRVMTLRFGVLTEKIDEAKAAFNSAQEEKNKFTSSAGEKMLKRDELRQIISECTDQLREASSADFESTRMKKFSEALASMKRLYPGVKGRLSELCSPSQGKYKEAVAVIFAKMMDAIVVDNEKTASECISYLKEQRACTATFLPLSSLRPRPLDEGLRRLGGSVKLCIDVLKFDTVYAPAVRYAAGNALVCDTLDEARKIRYEQRHAVKICSTDGTLIEKSGLMTGGSSSGPDRGKKWDRPKLDGLKAKRDEAQQELDALGQGLSDRNQEEELNRQFHSAKKSVQGLEQDFESTHETIKNMTARKQELTSEIKALRREVQKLDKDIEKRISSVEESKNELENLRETIFGDFAEKSGVASVAEFEDRFVKRVDMLREQLIQLEGNKSKIESELTYQRSRDLESAVQKKEESTSRLEQRMQTIQEERASIVDNKETLRAELADLEETLEDAKKTLSSVDANFKELKQAEKQVQQDIAEKRKLKMGLGVSLEQLKNKEDSILMACQMEQVEIPKIENEEADDMETDDAKNYDFSVLPRKLRDAKSEEAKSAAGQNFEVQERTLKADLERIAPNLRPTDHLDEIQARVTQINKDFDEARTRATEASEAFEEIRKERTERFMKCFNQIANKIDEVYKDLTKSQAYPLGGTAYLSLESQEDPFLSGIKFNAMPPTKRFRDMEQLSGGERTVAALALLFSIHYFRPSPFFVMDEIDAALDNINVGKVSSYIQSRAPDLQTIVISLKDSFYEKADALVGIHRDHSVDASRVLTLDLSQYGEE